VVEDHRYEIRKILDFELTHKAASQDQVLQVQDQTKHEI